MCEAEIEAARKTDELTLQLSDFTTNMHPSSFESSGTFEETQMIVPTVPAGISGTALAASLLRKWCSSASCATEDESAVFKRELDSFYKERAIKFDRLKLIGEPLDYFKLWRAVNRFGGYERVIAANLWQEVKEFYNPPRACTTVSRFRVYYEKALLEFEKCQRELAEVDSFTEKYPPPTELLNVQPLPVTALMNPSYEALYHEFKQFNPVQTQVFTVLYHTDDNVLVAAPTGSGKTVCAEFAIFRNHQKGPESVIRAVYIAPIEALAKERYRDWKGKFGKGLGLRVVELTGEMTTDMKLIEKGQIIITTPENWDALSRLWKEWKYVNEVSLFIIDELQLIGGQGGPVLEVIVSRMSYMASHFSTKIRIVALATSLANAKDLGEWIGATSRGLFNFSPGVRVYEAFPVESHLQHYLHDSLNAEVAAKVIENMQDAVDYLTRTYMYRRLTQNPNHYNLRGVSRSDLSDYLSALVKKTLSGLEVTKCVAIEDDKDLSALNLGMIAYRHYISYSTIERFSTSLTVETQMKGLLEILSSASEYQQLPVRPGEEDVFRRLMNQQTFYVENPKYTDPPHLKAFVLLQAHFSRHNVGGNLAQDLRKVVLDATRLLEAIVGVIFRRGWLNLALLTMKLSQMVVQGRWECDSIASRFPSITLTCKVMDAANVYAGGHITLQVQLESLMKADDPDKLKVEKETWWLIVGDDEANQLLAFKRVSLQESKVMMLHFSAPAEPGKKSYALYFMTSLLVSAHEISNSIQ